MQIRNWEYAFSTNAGGSSADGGDQAGFGVVGGHVGDVLDVWPNEVVQRVQVGGGGMPVREGYKVVALLLKPSLGLFGLVGRCRVLLPHPGSATGHLIAPGDHHTLQHIQVHFGVDFQVQADFEDVRWHDVALTWNHTKDHNSSRQLCFHHPGHVPVIRGNPAMVLAVVHLVQAEVLFVWKEPEHVWFLGMLQFVLTDLISLRFFVFSVKISFTYAFTVVCETPKSLAIYRLGRWGVSSMIAWTFSMNSLVPVFLAVSSALGFRSTTSKGSSDASYCAFWGCWQWSCCHKLDR